MYGYHRHATHLPVAIALAGGLLLCGPWQPQAREDDHRDDLSGTAQVVDGDTLSINGARVRLEGIDAPEASQICQRARGESWACGTDAANALARLVADKQIRCEQRGLDKYGRILGVCFAGAEDINARMVRHGYAWAFVKYSTTYVKEEGEARALRLGIWQGEATPPWEFRHERWAAAEQHAPEGCAIKGNVTAHGKIYHLPWSPWYAQIKVDPTRGRRWFCTEAEAISAGWRPVNLY